MSAPTDPLAIDGGDVGVLLCHGFTGSPASMRPWAEHLGAEGYRVRVPLLPGHGTTWQDMNRTTFDDWLAAVTTSLAELADVCRAVVVGGLSMGGSLALRLAELHPGTVSGLVLVNPAVLTVRKSFLVLPVLKHLVPSVPGISNDIAKAGADEHAYHRTPLRAADAMRRGWQAVRADLGAVTAPVLMFRSVQDHVVEPENAAAILAGIASTDVTEVLLHDSFHVATLDHDAELIFEDSAKFIARVTA